MSEKLDALLKNYHKKTNPPVDVVVFHVYGPTDLLVRRPDFPDRLEYTVPVASMELHGEENDDDACERAFMLTNTISKPWYVNTEITKLFRETFCRSTSVGDIVTVSRDGNVAAYKCDSDGWTETKVPEDQLQMSIRKVGSLDNTL